MPARGSTLADRHGAWRSLVAHLLWEQRVGGSNPSAPTNSGAVHSGHMGNTPRAPADYLADMYYPGQLAIMRVPNAVCTISGHRPDNTFGAWTHRSPRP